MPYFRRMADEYGYVDADGYFGEAVAAGYDASSAEMFAPRVVGPAVEFLAGDRVEHSAFGQGTVLSITPMGGDALMEVQFGEIRKKLMWKTAGAHMKKI